MAGGDLANAIQLTQKYAYHLESRQNIQNKVTFLTDDINNVHTYCITEGGHHIDTANTIKRLHTIRIPTHWVQTS